MKKLILCVTALAMLNANVAFAGSSATTGAASVEGKSDGSNPYSWVVGPIFMTVLGTIITIIAITSGGGGGGGHGGGGSSGHSH